MSDGRRSKCFIIMPITMPEDRLADYGDHEDHFEHVIEALFIPAIEAADLDPQPPQFAGSPVIQAQIIRNLVEAELVLCDMSVLNPNVFFELGVRTAMNRPVAAVRDHLTPRIPFDVGSVSAHQYDGTLAGWRLDEERQKLTDHLRAVLSGADKNELWSYFGITKVAHEPPEASPMEALELMVQQILHAVSGPRTDGATGIYHKGPIDRLLAFDGVTEVVGTSDEIHVGFRPDLSKQHVERLFRLKADIEDDYGLRVVMHHDTDDSMRYALRRAQKQDAHARYER